jgi:YhcH/YjgK/YiaL family protein
MIYDQTKKIASYKGLSKNLDAAIDYLLKNDITKLPDGKHPVVGADTVIVQLSHSETKKSEDARFETHKKYIDIQMVLEGKETCYCLPLEGFEEDGAYITERDVSFYKNKEDACSLILEPGVFAVFFPQDVHKPFCDFNGQRSKIFKAVVKVLI